MIEATQHAITQVMTEYHSFTSLAKEKAMNKYKKQYAPSVEPNIRHHHFVHGRMCRGLVMAAVGLVVSFGVAANASADSLKCKVDFKLTNEKSTAVKVVSIIYEADQKEHTEGLDNKKLSAGEMDIWKTVTLQEVAAGNPITRFRIQYRNDTSGQGKPSSPWGPVVKTVYLKPVNGGDCFDGRVYELAVP